MADNVTVQLGENSQEYMAWRLMGLVVNAEKRTPQNSDRAYLLATYEECLHVVKGHGQLKKKD